MAKTIFTISRYVGLWYLDGNGAPLQTKIYILIAMLISALDVAIEIWRIPRLVRSGYFSERDYIYIIENILSKIALISQCSSCLKNKKCFQKVFTTIGQTANPRQTKAAFIGVLLHTARFACIAGKGNLDYHHFLAPAAHSILECGKLLITLQLYDLLENSTCILKKVNRRAWKSMRFDVDVFDGALDAADRLNALYGRQVLTMIAYIFITSIAKSFILIRELSAGSPYGLGLTRFMGPLQNGLTVAICFYQLFLIVDGCHRTVKEVDQFTEAIFDAMRKNPYLRSSETLNLYIFMKPNLAFTANGYFQIDYPLLTSIITGVATYVFIIEQLYLGST